MMKMKKSARFPDFLYVTRRQIDKQFRFSTCNNKLKNSLVFPFVPTVHYSDLLEVRFNVFDRGAGSGRSMINKRSTRSLLIEETIYPETLLHSNYCS